MKTKIVSWIYTVCSSLGIIFSVLALSLFPKIKDALSKSPTVDQNLLGFLSVIISAMLIMCIIGLVWSVFLRRYKPWTWYVGLILFGLGILSSLFKFNVSNLFTIAVNVLFIWCLYSEKELFFGKKGDESGSAQISA